MGGESAATHEAVGATHHDGLCGYRRYIEWAAHNAFSCRGSSRARPAGLLKQQPAAREGVADGLSRRVLLDAELATLYGVEIRVLVQAVKRNLARFPEDFMFQLSAAEWTALRSRFVTLKTGRGQHRKYLPYAFTEQGVAMLSSVLRSRRAITVNIQIMRAFVRMRELLASNKELAHRLDELEARLEKKLTVRAQATTYFSS